MVFPHLFGMQEDELDVSSLQRQLQADQSSMRATPNQSSLQSTFQQLAQQGQQGNPLFQQSMFQQHQQQQQEQQFGQQSNNQMLQMMGPTQSQQQFGSNSFSQGGGMSATAAGSVLLNRFQELSSQLSDSQQQQQQQQHQQQQATTASLLGGNGSFLDGFSQQQSAGGIQSNLRHLEMANELMAAQRRLSLGFGAGGNSGGLTSNSSLQQQLHGMSGGDPHSFNPSGSMLNNFSAKNTNQPFSLAAAAGLDPFQGGDTSNLEGLMASQLQQQQQQQNHNQQNHLQQQQHLSLQQQLMMAAAQQQERRHSLSGAGIGAMDSALGMQLSMMAQQQPTFAGSDFSSSQHQFTQFQQQSQLNKTQDLDQQNPDSQDETDSLGGKAHHILSTADDSKAKPARKKKAKTFPEKLMQAITSHGEEDAVAWLPDGKSFVIVNDDLFVDQVLNKVFKESKYSSFVRKLHRWGFVRLTSGTGTDCFHHPLFQRGRRDLASKITCTPRDKDGNLKTPHRNMKPPSLAGVERFIRQKADAAVAMAEAKARRRDSDPDDSIPLQNTSGVGGGQVGTFRSQTLDGMDKSTEPLGINSHTMSATLPSLDSMNKDLVRSIGLGGDIGQINSPGSLTMAQGERADV